MLQPWDAVSVKLCTERLGCKMEILFHGKKNILTYKPPPHVSACAFIWFLAFTQSPIISTQSESPSIIQYTDSYVSRQQSRGKSHQKSHFLPPYLATLQTTTTLMRPKQKHTHTHHCNFCDKRKQLLFFGVAGDNMAITRRDEDNMQMVSFN